MRYQVMRASDPIFVLPFMKNFKWRSFIQVAAEVVEIFRIEMKHGSLIAYGEVVYHGLRHTPRTTWSSWPSWHSFHYPSPKISPQLSTSIRFARRCSRVDRCTTKHRWNAFRGRDSILLSGIVCVRIRGPIRKRFCKHWHHTLNPFANTNWGWPTQRTLIDKHSPGKESDKRRVPCSLLCLVEHSWAVSR